MILLWHPIRSLAHILILWTFCIAVCRADRIIDVQDAQLTPQGIGFVDVLIRSTGTDLVALANYKFEIVQLAGTGVLEFGESSNSTNLTDINRQSRSEQTFAKPVDAYDYIFKGDTAPVNFGATRQDPNKLQLVGNDFTASSGNVTLGTTDRLMARLELIHTAPLGSTGGTYRVPLLQGSDTFFLDENIDILNPVNIDAASFTNANSGLVTVGVAAVPEPSSLLLSTFAFAALGARIYRSRFAPASKV